MDKYIIATTIIGVAALSMAWLPKLASRTFLSYPILFLLVGMFVYWVPFDLPSPNPIRGETYAVHLTELSVIISLMGTGLKIRRKFGLKHWRIPLRLVSITMLLSIGALAFLGWSVLGFSVAAAVLLGAVLAPTDPVLAEQVQVGPPDDKEEDVVRFSLTAEAGLNDGSAFPFTWLAVVLAVSAGSNPDWFAEWVIRDLVFRIVVGVAMGYFIGWVLAYLVFKLPKKTNFPQATDGFLALSATLVSYGLTEFVHGYGFIAVFVTALTLSSYEQEDEYHTEMHDFINQIERIVMVILLMLFGGSIVSGLLDHLTWKGALIGLAFLFIIRPLTTFPSLIGTRSTTREKVAISFFGIRGIGSFFYLSFALNEYDFEEVNELWSVTGFIVMISIILHGLTASRAMRTLDVQREEEGIEPLAPDELPEDEEEKSQG